MELAHHLKELKTNVGVDFVFFDGEEYIFERERRRVLLRLQALRQGRGGKIEEAARLRRGHPARHDRRQEREVSRRGILVAQGQRAGACDVWGIAGELKCGAFQERAWATASLDDHLALQNVGIPAIDIIDFDYPHWHRLSDTPENCSAEPMEQVAKVLSVWLQRVK